VALCCNEKLYGQRVLIPSGTSCPAVGLTLDILDSIVL
jgi:hypothetical protein